MCFVTPTSEGEYKNSNTIHYSVYHIHATEYFSYHPKLGANVENKSLKGSGGTILTVNITNH
jgi:hypothetical protein